MSEANWYVVHTYSGYENKVKVDIEKTIENRKLQDQILEVSVPMQDVQELKNGANKLVAICADQHGHERRYMVCRAEHPRCNRLCRSGLQAGSAD